MLLGAEAAARRRGVTSELTSGENFTVLSFFHSLHPFLSCANTLTIALASLVARNVLLEVEQCTTVHSPASPRRARSTPSLQLLKRCCAPLTP